MKFDMTTSCHDCPFRKVGGIKLMPGRIREISSMMLDSQGGTFPCHKTVKHEDCDNEDGYSSRDTSDEHHCAGALIYAEKQGRATQMMRIAERFGMYDHTKLAADAFALVWDNMGQWLRGGTVDRKPNRQKKKEAAERVVNPAKERVV